MVDFRVIFSVFIVNIKNTFSFNLNTAPSSYLISTLPNKLKIFFKAYFFIPTTIILKEEVPMV